MEDNSLRPDERIQKLVLSTPPMFFGEYETSDIRLSLAWPPHHTGKGKWFAREGDPLGRSAIILSFRTPPPPEPAPGVMRPNYEYSGEIVASALSVLYGKRFDFHGPYEMSGTSYLPDMSAFLNPCEPSLRHNDNSSRIDYRVPLNLSEFDRIAPIVTYASGDNRVPVFHAAAKLYRRALIGMEADPEGAYLNLITAGEIVSNSRKLSDDDLYDASIIKILNQIREQMVDGERIHRLLKGQLRGIKKRFVSTLVSMVDDEFFDRREALDEFAGFKKETFAKSIEAAYDLRSRFVHSGFSFGRWVSLQMDRWEMPVGAPVTSDKAMSKILGRAPLLSGLERLIRFVLFQFSLEIMQDHKPE